MAIKGKGAAARLAAACAGADFVVISVAVPDPPTGCVVLDEAALAQAGGLALYPAGQGVRIVATSTPRRVWSAPLRGDAVAPVILPRALRVAGRQ